MQLVLVTHLSVAGSEVVDAVVVPTVVPFGVVPTVVPFGVDHTFVVGLNEVEDLSEEAVVVESDLVVARLDLTVVERIRHTNKEKMAIFCLAGQGTRDRQVEISRPL